MLVTKENFDRCLAEISHDKYPSLDTETTGLRWYDQDELFSIIISTERDTYYFNFNDIPEGSPKNSDYILPRSYIQLFKSVFASPDVTWFMHNAKFDLGMLSREGLRLAGTIHCTEAIARILNSSYMSYSLKECLKRLNLSRGIKGIEKSDEVEEYIRKHGLSTKVKIKGKKRSMTLKYYNKVPFDIMVRYGEIDGKATRELGIWQIEQIEKQHIANDKITNVVQIERKTTETTFKIEEAGLKLDREFTSKCVDKEIGIQDQLKKEFEGYTGYEYKDSGKLFSEIFDQEQVYYPTTEKGNPCFDKDSLEDIDHPVSDIIKQIRASEKRLGSYYTSFLYYQSKRTGRVHGSVRQLGADTGRMSIVNPAMQTIPKNTAGAVVRKCFIPEDGYCLFMPDYDQMEYRLMLDIAEESGLIELIKSGLDVHTATAEMVGVDRNAAKTINFMLLYGGGAQKLADSLNISLEQARKYKSKYFSKLTKVEKYIYRTVKKCEMAGGVLNQYGKFSKIPKKLAYKAPNYDIQGSCAYVVKEAMRLCDKILEGKKSRMILQVHDELIFEMHQDELDLCPDIVEAMESAYPYKNLKLSAGPSHSWKSWGDKEDGFPKKC